VIEGLAQRGDPAADNSHCERNRQPCGRNSHGRVGRPRDPWATIPPLTCW
jgi:hypothetical protein